MIELKPFKEADLKIIWEIGFREDFPEWSKWNSPYFDEYLSYDSFEGFKASKVFKYLLSDACRGIFVEDEPIGMVSRYWENEMTRWLEIGIIIYSSSKWSKGLGSIALNQWITTTFTDFTEIEHIGLTTWSGNQRMMRAAENIGMIQEACIRKVRYFEGIYYDSVKYGITRDEWENRVLTENYSLVTQTETANIRKAKIKDLKAIAEISRISLGYDSSDELVSTQLMKLVNNPSQYILVYEDLLLKKVVGFVQAELYQAVYFEDGLNILGLAVLPDNQGKGIGRELMTAIEHLAKEKQFQFIRLNSGVHRQEAHKFYEHIGYTSDKTQKRFMKIIQ